MSNYEVQDLSSNHHYRTEIPNIIFELGLKAHELAAYLAIKRAAGDGGCCTKSTKTLCKEAGVGERNFGKLKERLSNKFKIINKPLIIVKKRNSDLGDPDTDLISIVDIWPENYRYFIEKKGGGAKLQVPPILHQGGAKLHVKEEPLKKNPMNKNKEITTTKEKETSGGGWFSEDVILLNAKGQEVKVSGSDIYRHFLKFDYPTEIITQGIREIQLYKTPVNNILKCLEAICLRLNNIKKAQQKNPQKEKVFFEPIPKTQGKGQKFDMKKLKEKK